MMGAWVQSLSIFSFSPFLPLASLGHVAVSSQIPSCREEGRSPQPVALGLCLRYVVLADDSSSGHIVEFHGAYTMNSHILSRTIAICGIVEKQEKKEFPDEKKRRNLDIAHTIDVSCDYETTFITILLKC
jgi:hypothetical protein